VYGTLSLANSDPYVILLDRTADWPDIQARKPAWTIAPHFRIQVSNMLPCGYRLELRLEIRAIGYNTLLPVILDLQRPYD
jgi:hypothetical protein